MHKANRLAFSTLKAVLVSMLLMTSTFAQLRLGLGGSYKMNFQRGDEPLYGATLEIIAGDGYYDGLKSFNGVKYIFPITFQKGGDLIVKEIGALVDVLDSSPSLSWYIGIKASHVTDSDQKAKFKNYMTALLATELRFYMSEKMSISLYWDADVLRGFIGNRIDKEVEDAEWELVFDPASKRYLNHDIAEGGRFAQQYFDDGRDPGRYREVVEEEGRLLRQSGLGVSVKVNLQ